MFNSNSFSGVQKSAPLRSFATRRGLFLLSALVALSACETIDPLATPIGDQRRPLMAQGEGEIANSLEY